MTVACFCGHTFSVEADTAHCPACGAEVLAMDRREPFELDARDIRAMLRGATAAKIVTGWYWEGPDADRRYVVTTAKSGASMPWSAVDTTAYCEMLRAAGVEPLYRPMGPRLWEGDQA